MLNFRFVSCCPKPPPPPPQFFQSIPHPPPKGEILQEIPDWYSGVRLPFLCLRNDPSGSWHFLLAMKCEPWENIKSSRSSMFVDFRACRGQTKGKLRGEIERHTPFSRDTRCPEWLEDLCSVKIRGHLQGENNFVHLIQSSPFVTFYKLQWGGGLRPII